MIGKEESTWMLILPNQSFRNYGNALIQVGGSLDRLRGLDNWLLSSTNKLVSRIEKERLAKVPNDAPVTRHESPSRSALTGSTHWFETLIESLDTKGYVHRTPSPPKPYQHTPATVAPRQQKSVGLHRWPAVPASRGCD
jgi:hypothetical protein